MEMASIGTPALWLGFVGFVLAMLALDLGIFHRKAHAVTLREATGWSVVWISLALLFNAGIYHWFGPQRGLEFLTGYLIEKALAVDNIFVFYAIFAYFAVPAAYQHRVLFWGILGALVMRAIFIFVGAALIREFHWIMYVFGAILIVTAVKLLLLKDEGLDAEKNPIYRLLRRLIPSVPEYHGSRFTIVKAGKRYATPLLMVLLLIEWTDLVFAVDSIPAIFAVTSDPFIVFTSNIFAILGLRSLFFLLAGVLGKFYLLKPSLAFVLAFVGAKMLLVDVYKIPIGVSLGVIAALIAVGILGSLVFPKKSPAPSAPAPSPAGTAGARSAPAPAAR
jgi:tellurite resistance protein TerC